MPPPDIRAISLLEEGEWPPLEVELEPPTLPGENLKLSQRENTKVKPPCRIIQQGWMLAAYDDHGMAGLAVSPTERRYGLLYQVWTSKALPDPSRPVPLSWVLQGVEQVLEQALKSSEVLQEQEEA